MCVQHNGRRVDKIIAFENYQLIFFILFIHNSNYETYQLCQNEEKRLYTWIWHWFVVEYPLRCYVTNKINTYWIIVFRSKGIYISISQKTYRITWSVQFLLVFQTLKNHNFCTRWIFRIYDALISFSNASPKF